MPSLLRKRARSPGFKGIEETAQSWVCTFPPSLNILYLHVPYLHDGTVQSGIVACLGNIVRSSSERGATAHRFEEGAPGPRVRPQAFSATGPAGPERRWC